MNKKFIADENTQYCMLNQKYNLNNEAINWLRLYCAHHYGIKSSPNKYKISLDINSKAFIGAKNLEISDPCLEVAIA